MKALAQNLLAGPVLGETDLQYVLRVQTTLKAAQAALEEPPFDEGAILQDLSGGRVIAVPVEVAPNLLDKSRETEVPLHATTIAAARKKRKAAIAAGLTLATTLAAAGASGGAGAGAGPIAAKLVAGLIPILSTYLQDDPAT